MTRQQYRKYLESDEWKEFKRNYFRSFERECSKCGKRGMAVQLHHKDYSRLYIEKISDVEPLCEKCHGKVHGTYYPHGKRRYLLEAQKLIAT